MGTQKSSVFSSVTTDKYGRVIIKDADLLDKIGGAIMESNGSFDSNTGCHDNAGCGDVGCGNGGC